jgi:hypothetical protein
MVVVDMHPVHVGLHSRRVPSCIPVHQPMTGTPLDPKIKWLDDGIALADTARTKMEGPFLAPSPCTSRRGRGFEVPVPVQKQMVRVFQWQPLPGGNTPSIPGSRPESIVPGNAGIPKALRRKKPCATFTPKNKIYDSLKRATKILQ